MFNKKNKKIKTENYIIDIIKYGVIIILIIINIYILLNTFTKSSNNTFSIPTSPQINIAELKTLENDIKTKQIYTNNSTPPYSYVPNIFK